MYIVRLLKDEARDFFEFRCAGRTSNASKVLPRLKYIVYRVVLHGLDAGDASFEPDFDIVKESQVVWMLGTERVAIDDHGSVAVFLNGQVSSNSRRRAATKPYDYAIVASLAKAHDSH
jgi:hypothetical protein